jgi:hypothetical protein
MAAHPTALPVRPKQRPNGQTGNCYY